MPSNRRPSSQIAAILALATKCLSEGRLDDAIPALTQAVRMQPANASLHHDLGLALLETGRMAESVAAFQRAVEVDPRYSDAVFRLGVAWEALGNFPAAVRAYDRATELLPSHAEAWFRTGDLIHTLGHRTEALGCFRRAATAGRKNQFGRLGAARALLLEDREAEAEKVLRQTIVLDPKNAMALDLLGNLLAEAGRFEEAYDCFARAVAIAPLMGGAYYDLVRCRPMTKGDEPLIAQMQAALGASGLGPAQRLATHLALGKAADDRGDYAGAMQHFDEAHAVRGRLTPFDSTQFDAEIDNLIANFTPETRVRVSYSGAASAKPVFIVGMPRSGTTLVEQILTSHPDVVGAGELNYWNERGAAWRQSGGEALFLERAAGEYLKVLGEIGPSAARVTDKMPFNFLWTGLIHVALPNATIIHCRRAPIDTALSIHQTLFHQTLAFPTGGAELVAYFKAYRRLTDHWRRTLPTDRFFEVDYEQLTLGPEPEIRRIVAACGLCWNDACLRPEQNKRSVKTPSKWQTRQPIYRGSVGRWRRYQPYLGPLVALLNQ